MAFLSILIGRGALKADYAILNLESEDIGNVVGCFEVALKVDDSPAQAECSPVFLVVGDGLPGSHGDGVAVLRTLHP